MGARENIARLLMGKLGGPTPEGIRVYHSSPHDFDKFDLSKLRTGEGANVYGSGFYFAENPKVSGQGGQYWQQFTGHFPDEEQGMAFLLRENNFDRAKTMAQIRGMMDNDTAALKAGEWSPGKKFTEQEIADMRALQGDRMRWINRLGSNAPVGPRTYEVNIKAKPEELLDWDKPLSQQSKHVQDLLPQSGSNYLRAWRAAPGSGEWDRATGRHAYEALEGKFGDAGASEHLRDLGIPGIRYLDQGSRRGAGGMTSAGMKLDVPPPSYNYVGFDPSKLDILAKYGIAGAPAGLALGSMFDQSAYAAQPDTFDQRWGQQ